MIGLKRFAAGIIILGMNLTVTVSAQDVLPFPPTPSGSQAGVTFNGSIGKTTIKYL